MIPYFVKHNAKQFIMGKPIRFGYKIWVLTTPLGYDLQFEAYQGARGALFCQVSSFLTRLYVLPAPEDAILQDVRSLPKLCS